MDFETAYLNADLVYMEPPPELNLPADKVCLLMKALYGLKQSGKRWYDTIKAYLLKHGIVQSRMDACLFIRRTKAGVVFLLLFVDDVLLASSSQTARASVIEQLKRDFKITHKEKPDTYVGIRIEQDKDGHSLNHPVSSAAQSARPVNHSVSGTRSISQSHEHCHLT